MATWGEVAALRRAHRAKPGWQRKLIEAWWWLRDDGWVWTWLVLFFGFMLTAVIITH